MPQPLVEVYAAGPTTVVGFGGRDVLADVNIALCRENLLKVVRENSCQVLAFDLTGVRLMPSGLLGLLASLRKEGIEVHLYNPSEDVRDVLQTTNLDQVMPIHEVDVPGRERSDA